MRKLLLLLFTPLMFACGKKKESHISSPISDTSNVSISESQDTLNANSYEIVGTDHNDAVENFYVFIKGIKVDKDSLQAFVDKFKNEYCNIQCNINIIDTKDIYPLITEYPLDGKDYLYVADHFVAMVTFDDASVWMYPYQDSKYRDLGGKNWKKEPIK